MKKHLLTLSVASLLCLEMQGSLIRRKAPAPTSSEVAPTSSATVPTRRASTPPAASMPAVQANADSLKAAAASNPADVAAGLAKGLTQQYPGGNANNAAGQAAYSFVVGA